MAKPLNRPFRVLRGIKKAMEEEAKQPAPEEPDTTFAKTRDARGSRSMPDKPQRIKPPVAEPRLAPPERERVEHAFSVRLDGGRVEARRDDVEAVVLTWLERQEVDATIDLHGRRAERARRAVQGFVRARAHRGDRVILVVTGRGRHSASGGVLKAGVVEWLTETRMHAWVEAFVTAPPDRGGEGALLVLLTPAPKRTR